MIVLIQIHRMALGVPTLTNRSTIATEPMVLWRNSGMRTRNRYGHNREITVAVGDGMLRR
jgi:hypothetical protein